MTENFEKTFAVDGPVVNVDELRSPPFTTGHGTPAGALGPGQRWSVARKREVALRLLRGEPVEILSRELGVEIFRLEAWREKALAGQRRKSQTNGNRSALDSCMRRGALRRRMFN